MNQAIWVNVLSEKIWFRSPSTGLKIADSVMSLILRTREKGELNDNHYFSYWSERFPVRCIVPGGEEGFEDGYFPEEVNLYFPGIHESIVELRLLERTDGFAAIAVEESPLSYSAQSRERLHTVSVLTESDVVRSAVSSTLSVYFEASHEGWRQPEPNSMWVPPETD